MLWIFLLACDPIEPGTGLSAPPGSEPGPGRLAVDRATLDFGTISVLEDGAASRQLQVRNTGESALVIAGLHWTVGDEEAFTSDAPALLTLEPGASSTFTVTFQPPTEGHFEAMLFPNGEIAVPLTGRATAPVARLLPETQDLGALAVGCEESSSLVLLNDGSEALEIDDLQVVGSEAFELQGELPERLGPGEQATLELVFSPLTGGPLESSVSLRSNDPAASTTGLTFEGLGVPGETVTQVEIWSPTTQADVLFVVDSGASMASHLTLAQDSTGLYLESLGAGGVQWQVSVANGEQDCHATYDPYLSSEVYSSGTAGPALGYGLNPSGAGTSALLELALSVLERTDEGECMAGFLRPDAQLHVVLVTDEAESSPHEALDYLTALRAMVSADEDLVVSAVVGDGEGCTHGGEALIAASLSGGDQHDLCDQDWDGFFASLAALSVERSRGASLIELEAPAVEQTLQLTSAGRTLTAWTVEDGQVLLDGAADGLELGDPVELHYTAAQTCE